MPEASKAGAGPKGDRAHFPGVTTSTAPSAELSVAKNCQCVGQQRPAKAGKRRGERKEGWKALRKLHLIAYHSPWLGLQKLQRLAPNFTCIH